MKTKTKTKDTAVEISDPKLMQYNISQAMKVPRNKAEHRFERTLATAAAYLKCQYIKIPDPIYGSRRVRAMKRGEVISERRRPFDGIFITPADDTHYGGIYAIEAKYESNTLEKHQFNYLNRVKNLNGMAYVIRERDRKDGAYYMVEWPEKNVLYETKDISDFVKWFKELSRIEKQ